MKRLSFFCMLLFFLFSGMSKPVSVTNELIGKWKYMGAMKSQAVIKTDVSWYKPGKPTPKFEFIEFMAKKAMAVYNVKGGKPISLKYSVKEGDLIMGDITYKIKEVDLKKLTLTRSFYYVTGADGKQDRIDEEQISFQKVTN